MKLQYLIDNVDTSPTNLAHVDLDELSNAFDISNSWKMDWNKGEQIFQSYWLVVWYCTDAYVGMRVLVCNGHKVGLMQQSGRKCSLTVSYFSTEHAKLVKDALVSLVPEDSQLGNVQLLSAEELAEDEGEFYTIQYNSQIINSVGFIDDKQVKIIRTNYEWGTDDYFYSVEVEHDDGTQEKVQINQLKFKYHIVEPTTVTVYRSSVSDFPCCDLT
jgi:hypothetical protein